MITAGGVHDFTVELHGGFFTLAIIAIILTLLAQIAISGKESFPRLANAAYKSRGYLDATGIVAVIAGIIAIVISAITGLDAAPAHVLVDSVILRNKIVLSFLALVAWIWVAAMRLRLGRSLWTCPWSSVAYVIIALIAMSFTTVVGSLGADITTGGSLFDSFYSFIGLDPTHVDLQFSLIWSLTFTIISILVIFVVLLTARLSQVGREQLRSDRKCHHWPDWDEPTILPIRERERGDS